MPPASSSLRNRSTFLTLSRIPNERDNSNKYWVLHQGTPAYFREWCLLSEIVSDTSFVRLTLQVRDIAGQQFLVAFHTRDRGSRFAKQVAPSYTVAIICAKHHRFADGNQGIRVEDADTVKILPFSMNQLLQANDSIFASPKGHCAMCGLKTEQAILCGGCRVMEYCGRGCMQAGKAIHKTECSAVKAVSWFTKRDWRVDETAEQSDGDGGDTSEAQSRAYAPHGPWNLSDQANDHHEQPVEGEQVNWVWGVVLVFFLFVWTLLFS